MGEVEGDSCFLLRCLDNSKSITTGKESCVGHTMLLYLCQAVCLYHTCLLADASCTGVVIGYYSLVEQLPRTQRGDKYIKTFCVLKSVENKDDSS